MVAGPVPDLAVGWRVVDPGPPPLSRLLDAPPAVGPDEDPARAHQAWRHAVEQDEQRLARQHATLPVWFPIPKSGTHLVLPVYGGTPEAWSHLITGLTISAAAGRTPRFDRVRIANLADTDVLGVLRQTASSWRRVGVRFDEVTRDLDAFHMLRTSFQSVAADLFFSTH